MPRKTIADLERELAAALESRDKNWTWGHKTEEKLRESQATCAQLRAELDDARRELLQLRLEDARLNGKWVARGEFIEDLLNRTISSDNV